MFKSKIAAALLVSASLFTATQATAGAIHSTAEFTDFTLAANDDGSTGLVDVGFALNFFGNSYSKLFVNNNGNVTFRESLSTYVPFGLQTNNFPIIAPFFADVDTRGAGSGLVQYGQGTINGLQTFGVNWLNVGYYNSGVDRLNSFQLILTNRSDISAGDFDIQFNYDRVTWELGTSSGGVSAVAGYTDGGTNDFEFAGSRVNGAFLDSNLGTGLIYGSRNSNVAGQYNFNVRNGTIAPVSAPGTLAVLGLGLAGLVMTRRRQAK